MNAYVETFEIIGGIAAIITLIIVTYTWVYKLGGLVIKVTTMWDIYIVSAVQEAVAKQFIQRHSLYRITEDGKTALSDEVEDLIKEFADKNRKKLKDEPEGIIFDEFVNSKQFTKIRGLIIKDIDTKTEEDLRAILGLIFAHTVEKIKRSKED